MNAVIHQGALGDWVLVLPILRALAAEGRGVLAVAARSKARLAAAMVPGVFALNIDAPDWTCLHGEDAVGAMSSAGRERLALLDRVVSLVSTGEDAWAHNFRSMAPQARVAFVSPNPPSDWAGHVAEWHRDRLAAQGLTLPPADSLHAQAGNGSVIIHPGSGGLTKCWPRDRFEALIDGLIGDGRCVRPILGEAELERWPPATVERWRQRYAAEVIDDLETLRQRLAPASAYLGNDSGPTHLAAQLGLPTLGLFGPTSPARWMPRGPSVRVVAPPTPAPMVWLGVEQLIEVVREWLRQVLGPSRGI